MISEVLSKTDLLLLPKISLVLFVSVYAVVLYVVFSKRSRNRYKAISEIIFDETAEGVTHEQK